MPDYNVTVSLGAAGPVLPPGIYSVMAYGATGDGVTDDTTAIQAADTAASWSGGKVYFPPGTFLCGSDLTISVDTIWFGAGKRTSIIKRGFTGDFITAFGGRAALYDIGIDGDTSTHGAGKGILVAGSNPGQKMFNVEVKNFVEPCLEFAADGGSKFSAVASDFYTTGTVGSVGAVTVNGDDTQAIPRHFIGCESDGCTMYDFGGCSDFFVTGGFTNGLIFGASCDKVLINNMRMGALGGTIAIQGTSHKIATSVSAVAITVAGTGHSLDVEAPSWNITDNGTDNQIYTRLKAYTPTWSAASTAVSLGNGTIVGYYERNGSLITGFVNLTFGTTTTYGTGNWRVTLPRVDDSSFVQPCGSGFTQGPTTNFMLVPRVSPGNGYVELYTTNGSDTLSVVSNATESWGDGHTVRFNFSYFTT